MRDYEIATIKAVRKQSPKLRTMNDAALSRLWREWSTITFSASWITPGPVHVKCFIEWATTAPCDLKEDV